MVEGKVEAICNLVEGEVEARCKIVEGDVIEHLGSSNWELTDTFMSPLTASWGIFISPSRNLIATASSNKLCHVYNIHSHKEVARLSRHLDSLWAVEFSPTNQDLLGTTSFDYTCRVWNVNTQKCLHVLEGHKKEGHACGVWNVCFQPDNGHLIATPSYDCTAKLWNL